MLVTSNQQNQQQSRRANQMQTNGVNYYKGVLLCSRPNQSPSIPKQKPFCGRVTPHDAIGLVPTKKFDQHKVKKRNLPVLSNHKKWLEGFKKKIVDQKQNEQEQKQKEIEKLEKIKQEGVKRRQMFKKSGSIEIATSSEIPAQVNNQMQPEKQVPKLKESTQNKVTQMRKKIAKKERPQWSKTQKMKEAQQEQQVDELLDFFANDEIKDYLQDEQFSKMVKDLKTRIEQMKTQGNKDGGDWKKKQAQKIEQAKQNLKNDSDEEKKDDILSRISKNSEAKSMASQKTVQRVQQLERKKQQKQWDKNTITDKKSVSASVDEQIAKNVADEVLRNYPALKHHSNQSIRKLLQKQAKQQIKAL